MGGKADGKGEGAMRKHTVHQSAVTGHFVSAHYAQTHPATTFSHTVK